MELSNKKKSGTITKIFYAAAIYNLFGVLSASKFFTNDYLTSLDPGTFSTLGLIGVCLWGLAYGSVAKNYQNNTPILYVFVLEKMIYATVWASWLFKNHAMLPQVYEHDFSTGGFFTGYGFGDFVFGLFFLWVAITNKKRSAL